MTLLWHYKLDKLVEVPENVCTTSQIQKWHRPRGKNIEVHSVMEVTIKQPKLKNCTNENGKRTNPAVSCTLYEARSTNVLKPYNKKQIDELQFNLSDINRTIPFSYQLTTCEKQDNIKTPFGSVPLGSPLSYQLAN